MNIKHFDNLNYIKTNAYFTEMHNSVCKLGFCVLFNPYYNIFATQTAMTQFKKYHHHHKTNKSIEDTVI